MPTFSVIINNYNYRSFLPEAIDSILKQDCKDYELIVVDDGSDDGSVDFIKSLDVKLLLVETRRVGQARACLNAFKHANGQYIYFLDADDFAAENLLSTAARSIGDSPSKIQFHLVPVNANGQPFANPAPNLTTEHDATTQQAAIYKNGMPLSPPTSGNIFHRRVLEMVGDITYETAIDGVTLLVAPFVGQVVSIPRSLAAYRVHSSGHSAHANPLDANRIERDRNRFGDRIEHLNGILVRLKVSKGPVGQAKSFFYYWDCVTLEAAVRNEAIEPKVFLNYSLILMHEYGLTLFSLKKMAWLLIATAAPSSIKLRFVRDRIDPWPRRRVTNPQVFDL